MHKQASEQPDTHLNLVKYIKNLNRINLSTSIDRYICRYRSYNMEDRGNTVKSK